MYREGKLLHEDSQQERREAKKTSKGENRYLGLSCLLECTERDDERSEKGKNKIYREGKLLHEDRQWKGQEEKPRKQ